MAERKQCFCQTLSWDSPHEMTNWCNQVKGLCQHIIFCEIIVKDLYLHFRAISRSFCPNWLTVNHTYIHTLMASPSWSYVLVTYLPSLLWVSWTRHQSRRWAHSWRGLQCALPSSTVKQKRPRWEFRTESMSGPDLWHVLLLLFLGGVAHHLVDAEVRVGAVTESDGRGHSRHFLHHNDMIEVTQSCATILDWWRCREWIIFFTTL